MQSKSFTNKKYILLSLSGFTLVELFVSIMIMTIGFLGIMTLYIDVLGKYTQTRVTEEARFALSSQIEEISEDIKNAKEINVQGSGLYRRIEIEDEVEGTIEYSCSNNEGLLKKVNGMGVDFYVNTITQLFNEDTDETKQPYKLEVKCSEFDCWQDLSQMDNELELKKNFYTLTAEFELTSEINPIFSRTYKFKKEIFTKNKFLTGDSE